MFLIVDSLLLFVMCTVTLQRLRDSVTQIYTFIIIIIIKDAVGETMKLGTCEGCDGATDAGACSGHVHPVRHCRVLDSHHLHEESGRHTQGQEGQETGLHLSGKE